jgi:hypothetical protein
LFITNDLINGGGPGADGSANGTGTISLQFRMLSNTNNTGQRYLLAAPASSTNRNQFGLFLENTNVANGNPNSLKLRVGNTTTTIAPPQDLVPSAWYYFAMNYNESRDSSEVYWYLGRAGGSLTSNIFNVGNDAVVGDNGTLYLGNRDSLTSGFRDPGIGVIDEFAIWHSELSAAQIQAQFDAVTVAPTPAPTLHIALAGDGVLLSWSTNGTAGFLLESTSGLSSPAWTGAGTPTVTGGMYCVTNSLADGERYYRLRKP